MSEYNSEEFIQALSKHINAKALKCPYCGCEKFSTPTDLATILISKDKSKISLGSFIPSGVLICEKCGHMEFFALGALKLIKDKEEKKEDAQQKSHS